MAGGIPRAMTIGSLRWRRLIDGLDGCLGSFCTWLRIPGRVSYWWPFASAGPFYGSHQEVDMKVRASLKSLKNQPGAQVVRRRGRVYVINKLNPRFKGRQG